MNNLDSMLEKALAQAEELSSTLSDIHYQKGRMDCEIQSLYDKADDIVSELTDMIGSDYEVVAELTVAKRMKIKATSIDEAIEKAKVLAQAMYENDETNEWELAEAKNCKPEIGAYKPDCEWAKCNRALPSSPTLDAAEYLEKSNPPLKFVRDESDRHGWQIDEICNYG